jgi:hypothetical protein
MKLQPESLELLSLAMQVISWFLGGKSDIPFVFHCSFFKPFLSLALWVWEVSFALHIRHIVL